MTDEMRELARANAIGAGVQNTEFVKGYLEDMPLEDEAARTMLADFAEVEKAPYEDAVFPSPADLPCRR